MDQHYAPRRPFPLEPQSSSSSGPTHQSSSPSTSQLQSLEVKSEGHSDPQDGTHNGGSTTTASDFVKKLYKILEDKSVQHIISWGPKGDCFVVKDVTEFAKSLLPRMFKHSNFASFVRQLNKYDFHKVKTMDDEEGEETWTFKHPKFRAGRRDALDNIKRKVPGRRKSTGGAAGPLPPTGVPGASGGPSQDGSQTSSKIESVQAELSSLSAAHDDVLSHVRSLEQKYREVLSQMGGFQRCMAQQDGLMQNLIQHFLGDRDANASAGSDSETKQPQNNGDGIDWGNSPFLFMQTPEVQQVVDKSFADADVARATLSQMSEISRRAESAGMSFAGDGTSSDTPRPPGTAGTSQDPAELLAQIQDLQAQRERLLLKTPLTKNKNSSGGTANAGQEEEMVLPTQPSPADSGLTLTGGSDGEEMVLPTQPSPSTSNLGSDAWALSTPAGGGDSHAGLEVYTVGHLMPRDNSNNNFTDALGNWSYGGAFADQMGGQQLSPSSSGGGGSPPAQKSTLRVRRAAFVPGWAVPPRVLLVDDDAVSRMLSSKFLQVFGCTIDVAVDGVSAVNKMNLEHYDLVLMDIVMPKLDGVSATSMIRKFDPRTPIISMTGNARPTDVMTYYSSGMNDVLSKPFTKQGLFDMLEKHLAHLTGIKDKISTSMRIGSIGIPPLDDAKFESALQTGAAASPWLGLDSPQTRSWTDYTGYDSGSGGSPDVGDERVNLLAGMGVSDEQYNVMLSEILNNTSSSEGNNSYFGAKRAREVSDGDSEGSDPKRSRFEVLN
ncbi:HSF-type DNA-binding-domain-containing protein [Mycena polygramma]|nr:HSF-type DNA-binding-domain-containing protein [Mycena polygramma]